MVYQGEGEVGDATNSGPGDTSTLLIVSDNRIYREALRGALRQHAAFDPVFETEAPPADWRQPTETALDIVLIDANCNNLRGLVRRCASLPGLPRIVVMGIAEERDAVLELATLGIHGYLNKQASLSELVTAIHQTRRNEFACSPAVAGSLLQQVHRLAARQPLADRAGALTVRERQLAQLIAKGLSNKEIAAELEISVATVKSHVHHILEKLGVHRRTKVREAMRLLGV